MKRGIKTPSRRRRSISLRAVTVTCGSPGGLAAALSSDGDARMISGQRAANIVKTDSATVHGRGHGDSRNITISVGSTKACSGTAMLESHLVLPLIGASSCEPVLGARPGACRRYVGSGCEHRARRQGEKEYGFYPHDFLSTGRDSTRLPKAYAELSRPEKSGRGKGWMARSTFLPIFLLAISKSYCDCK